MSVIQSETTCVKVDPLTIKEFARDLGHCSEDIIEKLTHKIIPAEIPIHVGRMTWFACYQEEKDGYYAGRHAYRAMQGIIEDKEAWDEDIDALYDFNLPSDFEEYFSRHTPHNIPKSLIKMWQMWFMLGWFSKILMVDAK